MRIAFVLLLSSLPACDFYFEDDPPRRPLPQPVDPTDPVDCQNNPNSDAPLVLRDPNSGVCEEFYTSPPCQPGCPCPEPGGPYPSWPACYGSCEGLAEAACVSSEQCRAAYVQDTCPEGLGGCGIDPGAYIGCWQASGNNAPEDCRDLDAHECAQTDQCSVVHENCGDPEDGSCHGSFAGCIAEPEADATCAEIDSEEACIARTDCTALYQGENCTCTGDECVCQSQVFYDCT